ncbi:PEP-CTERM sorting domain-containing protein [Coraliomargarita sp. W4R53]
MHIKNIAFLAGAAVASTLSLQAAEVYSTDFGVSDEYAQNTGDVVFDNGTTTAVEEWFGSTNGVGIGSGTLNFNNTNESRYRGAGIWLDATGWDAGLVTVEFEVANYVAGGSDSIILFHTFAASGVDVANSVSLDLHGGPGLDGDPLVVAGTSTISIFGTEQTVTGSTTAVPSTESVTFTYNGTDEFIALVFAQENQTGSTSFTSANLDNLTVTTVPEPGTFALLAGLTGLVSVMLRRRRA